VRFAALHKGVTYALASLGLFALTLGSGLPLPTIVLIFAGVVASYFIGPSIYERAGYHRVWNGLVLGFFCLQILRGVLGGALLPLGIEFAAFLQVSRLFYRRSAKEHQQIQALAFLHLIAATILSTGLDYAFAFLGFVLVLPWMLALTHLRAEIEGHYAPEALADESRPMPEVVRRVLRSKRVAGPGFLLGTAGLSFPLFAVTAAFFLLFPRVGMGFLTFETDTGRSVAGFGSDVQLGGFGLIRSDPTIVLRIAPADLPAEGTPPERTFRLRGTSFDRYQGARWTRSRSGPARALRPSSGYYPVQGMARGMALEERYHIVLDPLDEQVLFLPDGTLSLFIPPRVEGAIDIAREVAVSSGLDLRYGDTDGLELRYDAIVDPRLRGAIRDELTAEDTAMYLQLPPGQERVAELANRIAGEGPPATRVDRLVRYLRDSGQLTYSLDQPDTRDRDPLEVFLFDAKRGHCEYFSTALAVMVRSLGIPARNVTGFVGGRWNEYGRYYAIRQGDAHSWVEVYLDGHWRTLDPTPPSRGDVVVEEDGWLADVRAFVDALRTRWSEDVVGYDLRQQVEGFRSLMRWFRDFRDDDDAGGDERSVDDLDTEAATGWLRHVPIVVGILALLYLARRLWRRRGAGDRKRQPPEVRAAMALYADLERALRKAGRPRDPATTPLEHVDALDAEDFPGTELAREITEIYMASRYGGAPLEPGAQQRLRARLGELGAP